jgi:hypothetical protein
MTSALRLAETCVRTVDGPRVPEETGKPFEGIYEKEVH